jgi:hypothetical protein
LGFLEPLERRELLSTTQNFDVPGTGFSLQQIGGPPPAQLLSGGPTGNFLRLATTPQSPVAGNDNSISFVTSDPGTFNEVTADWDFRVTRTSPPLSGVGMSFALLNTGNYGFSGQAASLLPEKGIYDGSVAFGFDTANDQVFLSFGGAIVTAQSLAGSLDLASGQFIHAHADFQFTTHAVSLVLTPSLFGSPVTVFNATVVPSLAPYQSRVSLQARNSSLTFADFDLDNVNVQFLGLRQAGTIEFGSPSFVANENQGTAQIDVVRTGGTAGSVTVGFVAADGTAKNGVNYVAVSGTLTFTEGQSLLVISVPIIDDGIASGDKTVKVYLSNPTLQAPLGSPIVTTLTIKETDPVPPTVSPKVTLIRAGRSRRVSAFRLTFSQRMDPTSTQNLGNYQVILPPARRHGPQRVVPLSQAVLDPSGLFVTLVRGDLGPVHLTRLFSILVRSTPPTGISDTAGTFLAGAGGVPGTNALLIVSA